MGGFPKGLQVLLVDASAHSSEAERALRSPALGYYVTAVGSLEAAQACFAGAATAYDCVLLEYGLLAGGPAAATTAFFKQAAAAHAPVVLMAASPSQAAVLEGVRLGAVDFLERPLSFAKLRTLWTHKIRTMMATANGGVLPRVPSCPQLATADSGADSAGCAAAAARASLMRSGSVPGLSCPATPSICAPSVAMPQPSSSLGSGDSGLGGAASGPSDVTSGAQHSKAATPASGSLVAAPMPLHLPAAPLACLQLGAVGDALPSLVHWPCLAPGTTWGTPVGCGVPPPQLPGSPGAAAEQAASAAAPPPELSIKWCRPGALPAPASTYELLLPEDFSLHAGQPGASEACGAGACTRGPLGLRLTLSPDLLADINSCLAAQQVQRMHQGRCAAAQAPAGTTA